MAPERQLSFAGGTLLLRGVWKSEIDAQFPPGCWQWDARVSGWRCDAGHYAERRGLLPRLSRAVADDVPGWHGVAWPAVRLPELRADQRAARTAWAATGRGVIVMPTGAGKTEVALAAMADAAVSTLVVAPIRNLMYQWHARIAATLGYEAGVIGDGQWIVKPISVTTYDSACVHMERLGNRFGLVIFDECHHLPGRIRQDAARMCAAPMRLGLTATPERADGGHLLLDTLIGPRAYQQELAEVRGKTLADYDVQRIRVRLEATEQTRYDQLSRQVRRFLARRRQWNSRFDWHAWCAAAATDDEAAQALQAHGRKREIEHRAVEKLQILEDLFQLHAGEPCLVFAGSNAMVRDISRHFLIPGLIATSRRRERADILRGFAEGRFGVMVANRVLDEGVDLPEAKVAIVVGGSASTRQWQQRLGRILRPAGNARSRLYEVVCADTNEMARAARRRKHHALPQSGLGPLRP